MNYKVYIDTAIHYINNSLKENNVERIIELQYKAIDTYTRLLDKVDITDYLLIDTNPEFSKKMYIESLFNVGTLYKNIGEIKKSETDLRAGLSYFGIILGVDQENDLALKQITSIYTILSYNSQNNLENCLIYLQEALLYVPCSETIHYNLGFVYQRLNKIDLAIIHYKLSLKLTESSKPKDIQEYKKMMLNNYNGIACIYRSLKRWPDSLHYLKKACEIDPDDPDINNALGIIYTEMRRTDLAEASYTRGLENINSSFITTDRKCLESDLYLNYGHMRSYNGDNKGAIECYNKAIKTNPKYRLPFQNKIMNLNYLFDEFDDKMYITEQHKLINKIIKNKNEYNFDKYNKISGKINIGIISGDFVDHPVSFFTSTFLKYTNFDKFTITCYSECIVDTRIFNSNIKSKLIKGMDSKTVSDLIYNDNIHILFDLAGHTAFNRIDVFALKPSPIQITYIGYPFTTGLNNMDYRITDTYCDNELISQKFYTEQLLYLKGCFLCYDPYPKGNTTELHLIEPNPFLKNEFITIGCFNRINKITDNVVRLFNDILLECQNVRFMFKTKALLNKDIKEKFIGKFSESVRDRLIIVDCTILHETHLLEYNKMDIAIDTFPYSGTTTSCEALLMGVPVFTLWDTLHYFHPQNVTVSILKNSQLDFYVCDTTQEIIDKIKILQGRPREFWETLKNDIRKLFIGGKVCNKKEYIENMETLLLNLVKSTL